MPILAGQTLEERNENRKIASDVAKEFNDRARREKMVSLRINSNTIIMVKPENKTEEYRKAYLEKINAFRNRHNG